MIELKIPTKEEIDLITFDNEIYERASDDTCPSKEWFRGNFNYDLFYFMGCFLDGKIIGLACIEKNGQFHFEVLKEYRKKYAREALRLILRQLKKEIFCEIPTLYQGVINFAKNHGFKEVGISTEDYIKNGIFYKRIKLIYE